MSIVHCQALADVRPRRVPTLLRAAAAQEGALAAESSGGRSSECTSSSRWPRRSTGSRIITNVTIEPSRANGLTTKSIADCLQTRPVDHGKRLVKIRGRLTDADMTSIGQALRVLFALA
jgi:hypothetical protein